MTDDDKPADPPPPRPRRRPTSIMLAMMVAAIGGPLRWRLPGHHRCAIEKLQGAEGAAKLGVVDEGEIEAAQGSLEL